MNKQVKAALKVVRSLISDPSDEVRQLDANDDDTRKAVAAELLAAMSPPGTERAAPDANSEDQVEQQLALQRERSRQLFMELGYFDEAVQDLRTGNSAGERAAAARTLGLVGNKRATVHLVAAMFDEDAEVRDAAGEALALVEEPTVADPPLSISLDESAMNGATGLEAPPTEETESINHPPMNGDTASSLEPEPLTEALSLDLATESDLVSPESNIDEVRQPALEVDKPAAIEEQFLLEEHAARESIEECERQLLASAALRQKVENEARWRAEREARIVIEAEARRAEEEQQRRRTEDEVARRRSAEAEALATEYSARQQAEAEIHRLIQEETRLRLETGNLRTLAEELSRKRWRIETSRREEAAALQLAEVTHARQEAEEHHQKEVERLQNEEQALRFAAEEAVLRRSELEASRKNSEAEISALIDERTRLLTEAEALIKQYKDELAQLRSAEALRRTEAERVRSEAEARKKSEEEYLQQQMEALTKATNAVSTQRAQVEAARVKAEQDAERLAESLVRMRTAEESRARAEEERLQVEATTRERVANEERLLEEARRRSAEEHDRLAEEKRRYDESERQRMAALAAVHLQTETEAKQRAEKEKRLRSEIDHIRIEDAEVRRRIEEAESLKRTSEQAYRVAAEKVQRIEAEAHAAALQETQMLEKLEAVRRDLAGQAQARAAQEKRIKEEIEEFHRLQDEERPRLEAAILQRTAAVARLQQMREAQTELPPRVYEPYQTGGTVEIGNRETAPERPVQSTARDEGLRLVARGSSTSASQPPDNQQTSTDDLQPAVGSYLKSDDPYKRAAALAELARSKGASAFGEIAKCFDDDAPQVRNAAARALGQLDPARTVDFFNRAIEEGTEVRRRNIGTAIAGSGLADEAIDNLAGENREDTYNALSILFVMAKTGEVQPLVRAIEEHHNDEACKAVVKLLALSGQGDLAEAALKNRNNG